MSTITAPPFPTEGKLAAAAAAFERSHEEFEQMMFGYPFWMPLTTKDGYTGQVKLISPHPVSGQHAVIQSDVLVIGKQPNSEEVDFGRNFSGQAGDVWKRILDAWKVDYSRWMTTNVCWYHIPDADGFPAAYVKEFQRFLALTYEAVKPKFVLLFGSDALQWFWRLKDPKSKMKLKDVRGAVLDFETGVQAVAIPHPGAVFNNPYEIHEIERGLRIFKTLLDGQRPDDLKTCPEEEIFEIDNQVDLDILIDYIIECGHNRIAIDCEWGDGNWRVGKLRTIQISWARGMGAVIILRRQGLRPAFSPSIFTAIESLSRLFKRPGVTVVGHNARGDLKWTAEHGLDLTEEFINGGFDTMLGAHLLDEAGELQLELVAGRMCGTPRYDLPLRQWLTQNGIDKKQIEIDGYGYVPDEILHPYAVRDAIVTWMLDAVLVPKLQAIPELWHLYTTGVHKVHLPIDEMERTGIHADQIRLREQIQLFKAKQQQLLSELKVQWNWPDFNPRSVYHMRDLLFSVKPIKDGVVQSCSPPGAITLNLTPVKTTDDVPWDKALEEEDGRWERLAPSTDSESVSILSAEEPRLEKLRTFKVIDQIMKNFLRPAEESEDGAWEWTGGLGKVVDEDGRIRTNFRQTLETGRYATYFNLQNLPKRQEKEIRKAFEDQ